MRMAESKFWFAGLRQCEHHIRRRLSGWRWRGFVSETHVQYSPRQDARDWPRGTMQCGGRRYEIGREMDRRGAEMREGGRFSLKNVIGKDARQAGLDKQKANEVEVV